MVVCGKRFGRGVLGLWLWLTLGAGGASVRAQGLEANLRWVEVEVAFAPDGLAMVQYKIRWNVQRGTMGAFTFQSEQAPIEGHLRGGRRRAAPI